MSNIEKEQIVPSQSREVVAVEPPQEQKMDVVPPQYQGLPSEAVEELWAKPSYIDAEKNALENERRESALAEIRKKEEDSKALGQIKAQRAVADKQELDGIRRNLGISLQPSGESKEPIFQVLSESLKIGIEDKLAQSEEENDDGVPPQFRGLKSDILKEIWIIPSYIDPNKTKELEKRKNDAIQALRAKEILEAGKTESKAVGEKIPETILSIKDRKKLSGWNASWELAKVAKQQNIDLSKISREEYVDFAIKNSLVIDDSQLRMAPKQRMSTSIEEYLAENKNIRANIRDDLDLKFANFRTEMINKAESGDLNIQEGVRLRTGTKDDSSWLFFKINNGTAENSTETFKSYIAVKDLNKLTPEKYIALMGALKAAGYNGDIKIFQDLKSQGPNLNDQIVMHGASENDAKLALSVAEKFFGDELECKSVGKDQVIDGENRSYSQILASKIKNEITQTR